MKSFFQKGVDNLSKVCYNKNVKRDGKSQEKGSWKNEVFGKMVRSG